MGRAKKIITRGIARALTASLLLGVVGNHAAAWTITAQAAETDSVEEENYTRLAVGGYAAAIKKDGSLWMCGKAGYGTLGDGETVKPGRTSIF